MGQKFYKKATVQAAILAGVFTLVATISGNIFNQCSFENDRESNEDTLNFPNDRQNMVKEFYILNNFADQRFIKEIEGISGYKYNTDTKNNRILISFTGQILPSRNFYYYTGGVTKVIIDQRAITIDSLIIPKIGKPGNHKHVIENQIAQVLTKIIDHDSQRKLIINTICKNLR